MRKALDMANVLIAFSLLLLAGCGGSDSEKEIETREDIPELSTQFAPLPNYAFEDFSFDQEVRYWELKTGPHDGYQDCAVETAWRYDDAQYEALPDELRSEVDAAEAESGFQVGVQVPCVTFGVAVIGPDTALLTTDAELLAFLAGIDSEAKLNMWLWANDYNGITYDVVDGGYEAIAKTVDIMCLEDRYYHLFVDTAGVITELEMVSTAKPQMCP